MALKLPGKRGISASFFVNDAVHSCGVDKQPANSIETAAQRDLFTGKNNFRRKKNVLCR